MTLTITSLRHARLDGGGLGARRECVSQAALATVLTVFVEGHLDIKALTIRPTSEYF